MPEKREQEDVLKKKGHVTKSSIGLQQWGDEATPEGERDMIGTAGRQARLKKAQQDEEPE